MMKIIWNWRVSRGVRGGLLLLIASAAVHTASAQTKSNGKPAATPPAQQQQPAQAAQQPNAQRPVWNAQCTSPSRQGELECAMEQTAVLKQTGQLVTKVMVRVPAKTRAPVMMIQVPVGLYLPAGITVQVDAKKPQQFPVQTCDLSGCFAGLQLSKELLEEFGSGSRLTVVFQNTAQEKITVPMSLSNFSEAYSRIK